MLSDMWNFAIKAEEVPTASHAKVYRRNLSTRILTYPRGMGGVELATSAAEKSLGRSENFQTILQPKKFQAILLLQQFNFAAFILRATRRTDF
jgi:hypothetical protein